MLLRLLLSGFIILISAIVLNAATQRLGIMGWYEFLSRLLSEGRSLWPRIRIVDGLWLVFLYPLLLGLSALMADKIWTAIHR